MKRLYARYYIHKESNTPWKERVIADASDTYTKITKEIYFESTAMHNWMYHYSDGKVEFVWLEK